MNCRGFTLIELMVTIAVVGALMGALLMVLNPANFFNQGQDGRRVAELGEIQAALELSFADDNHYPSGPPAGVPVSDPDGNKYLYCPHSPATVGGTDYMKYEVCADLEVVTNSNAGCTQGTITVAGGDDCTTYNCCLTNPF